MQVRNPKNQQGNRGFKRDETFTGVSRGLIKDDGAWREIVKERLGAGNLPLEQLQARDGKKISSRKESESKQTVCHTDS